eukprot:1157918-Pelagomonas_calceolata.AAC.1
MACGGAMTTSAKAKAAPSSGHASVSDPVGGLGGVFCRGATIGKVWARTEGHPPACPHFKEWTRFEVANFSSSFAGYPPWGPLLFAGWRDFNPEVKSEDRKKEGLLAHRVAKPCHCLGISVNMDLAQWYTIVQNSSFMIMRAPHLAHSERLCFFLWPRVFRDGWSSAGTRDFGNSGRSTADSLGDYAAEMAQEQPHAATQKVLPRDVQKQPKQQLHRQQSQPQSQQQSLLRRAVSFASDLVFPSDAKQREREEQQDKALEGDFPPCQVSRSGDSLVNSPESPPDPETQAQGLERASTVPVLSVPSILPKNGLTHHG